MSGTNNEKETIHEHEEEVATDDSNLTDKQKARLKYLAERAGVTYEEAVSTNMSQRRLKKMASSIRYAEILQSKRKEEKEKRKTFRKLQREAGQLIQKERKTRTLMKDSNNKVCVAIDLSFDGLMSNKDKKKLRKQLLRCYSCNRSSEAPLQLYLTSVGDEIISEFEGAGNMGFDNWDVHVSSKSYLDVFNHMKSEKGIIYLTRDSENVLPSSDVIRESAGQKVYIIGGLVDHNTLKGFTLEKAKKEGIEHARLPIDEYMKMLRSQVLTVNHVFELMLLVSQGTSWADALEKVIPQRKRKPECRKAVGASKTSAISEQSDSDSSTDDESNDRKRLKHEISEHSSS